MGEYLDWMEFGVMFVVILIIQFVTRTKAVADGMMYRQIMLDNQMDANDIIQKIKEETDKARRNNDIN